MCFIVKKQHFRTSLFGSLRQQHKKIYIKIYVWMESPKCRQQVFVFELKKKEKELDCCLCIDEDRKKKN